MRRAMLAAVLALVVMVWPAAAQAPTDQTIMDAIIVLHPPDISNLCMDIGAGTLTVMSQVTTAPADGAKRQIAFDLNGYQGDQNAGLRTFPGPSSITATTQLTGAMYCWRLWVAPWDLPLNAAQMS